MIMRYKSTPMLLRMNEFVFVYTDTIGTVTQTEGTTATTVNEGSPVKFTCSASSTSLPAQFRPDPSTLVYTIYVCNIGYIQRQSDGSVIATNNRQGGRQIRSHRQSNAANQSSEGIR